MCTSLCPLFADIILEIYYFLPTWPLLPRKTSKAKTDNISYISYIILLTYLSIICINASHKRKETGRPFFEYWTTWFVITFSQEKLSSSLPHLSGIQTSYQSPQMRGTLQRTKRLPEFAHHSHRAAVYSGQQERQCEVPGQTTAWGQVYLRWPNWGCFHRQRWQLVMHAG